VHNRKTLIYLMPGRAKASAMPKLHDIVFTYVFLAGQVSAGEKVSPP
jgi:hypothetical protein